MKWYYNLADNEKKLIKYGALIIAITFFWRFVYIPISESIDSKFRYKNQLIEQTKEMNSSIEKLDKINHSNTTVTRKANQPFISWIDDQLINKDLAQFVVRSEPKDNKTLILLFENIVFDDFIMWLEPLVSQYNIIVSEADVNSLDRETGLCNIRITLVENI